MAATRTAVDARTAVAPTTVFCGVPRLFSPGRKSAFAPPGGVPVPRLAAGHSAQMPAVRHRRPLRAPAPAMQCGAMRGLDPSTDAFLSKCRFPGISGRRTILSSKASSGPLPEPRRQSAVFLATPHRWRARSTMVPISPGPRAAGWPPRVPRICPAMPCRTATHDQPSRCRRTGSGPTWPCA